MQMPKKEEKNMCYMFVHDDYLGTVRSVKRPWASTIQFVARPRVKLDSTEASERAETGAWREAAVRAWREAAVRAWREAVVRARRKAAVTGITPTSTKTPFVDVGSGYSIIQVVVETIIAFAKGAVVILADGCFAWMALLPIQITIVRIGVGMVWRNECVNIWVTIAIASTIVARIFAWTSAAESTIESTTPTLVKLIVTNQVVKIAVGVAVTLAEGAVVFLTYVSFAAMALLKVNVAIVGICVGIVGSHEIVNISTPSASSQAMEGRWSGRSLKGQCAEYEEEDRFQHCDWICFTLNDVG